MGLAKFFAKLGAPGSMTKSVVKGYRAFKSTYPDMSDNDIYHEIIKVRYIREQDKRIYESVAFKIGSYKSLYDLIMEMMMYENRDYLDLPRSSQTIIKEAIKDILKNEGF